MNAHSPVLQPDPSAPPPPPPSERGWTAEAQADFLEQLSRGHTVEAAARSVGLGRSGAYGLRHRDPLFAQGWAAAELLARDSVAEVAVSRALDGFVEVTEWSADRLVRTRRRHDNRLLMATLSRLDRVTEQVRTAKSCGEVRAIGSDFAGFLDRLRSGAEHAAAFAARHRMSEARIEQIEQNRFTMLQNMLMYGLSMREMRVQSRLPTDDFDAILEKLCAALGEPPFDWDNATHEEALARDAEEFLDPEEQDIIFNPDEVLNRGLAIAAEKATRQRAERAAAQDSEKTPGMRPLCPLGQDGAPDPPPLSPPRRESDSPPGERREG